MKKATIRDLVFMAICVALSLVGKRMISPVTNGLTDFFRIPGGSAATGFSLAFLIIGKCIAPVSFAATMMSVVQFALALSLGFSGYQGIMAVFSYVIPGLLIDLLALAIRKDHPMYCFLAGILSSVASAVISTFLVFRLSGLSLLLWILLAALSGALGGLLARWVYIRLRKLTGQGIPVTASTNQSGEI